MEKRAIHCLSHQQAIEEMPLSSTGTGSMQLMIEEGEEKNRNGGHCALNWFS